MRPNRFNQTAPNWTTSSSLFALAAVACVLVAAGCSSETRAAEKDPQQSAGAPVEVQRLAPTTHQQQVAAVATVEPWRRVTLRAEVAARVTSLKSEVGQRVRAGAVLARLNSSVASRSYQATRVTIQQGTVTLNKAQIDLKRAETLHARGTYTQAQLDQARSAKDGAAAALALARAQTSQAGQQLTLYNVRAPFAGVISKRSVELGDYASPGAAIYTLVDDRRLKLVVGLDPAVAGALKPGDPAELTLQMGGEQVQAQAQVHLVRPVVESATRRQEVELSLDNKKGALRPGLVAQVQVPVGPPRPALLVSTGAVVELSGQHHVYVVRDGKAARLPVTLGVSTTDQVEIKPQGAEPVRAGDMLVVTGVRRLSQGAPVQIVKTVASAAGAMGVEG